MTATPSPQWQRWLGLAALSLLLIGLWQVPWLGWLVYPFRVFGTFVHELSHGMTAIATGGTFLRFQVSSDLSGVAQSSGGVRMLIASAGYVGSAVFGGVLLLINARGVRARWLLAAMGLILALLAVLFLRNAFGWLAAGVLSAGLLGAAWRLSERWQQWLFDLLALQLVLDGYSSLWTVWQLSGDASVATDAQSMANLTWLPAWSWAVIWALFSTIVLVFCVRASIRRA
ncbi:M50 family metallopeptidase [Ahniella affigens]|uniref:M50 family metallopeptidase n=1 Tax=Ahniella affigens TaxID=2021234 RepID=UPI001473B85D|nr:M50 family metallopeptidase [Ahniella affigens]